MLWPSYRATSNTYWTHYVSINPSGTRVCISIYNTLSSCACSQPDSELAIGWQHALPTSRPPFAPGDAQFDEENYAPQIPHRLHPLHCNFVEKHDLSTPGCCPGVAGCCFADKLLCSVHTEQLPSVYLCAGRAPLSSHSPSSCEWAARAHIQDRLCCRARGSPTFRVHALSFFKCTGLSFEALLSQ